MKVKYKKGVSFNYFNGRHQTISYYNEYDVISIHKIILFTLVADSHQTIIEKELGIEYLIEIKCDDENALFKTCDFQNEISLIRDIKIMELTNDNSIPIKLFKKIQFTN